MSSKKMTFWAQTSKGIVTDTASIARRFIGQPFKNLKAWLRRQGGFKCNCINEGEATEMITGGGEIRVVHCKRESYDVYIGRPSKWGNPFSIGKNGTREEVISKYEAYIMSKRDLIDALPELRGKVLGCWCSPNACHGDILKIMVEDEIWLK